MSEQPRRRSCKNRHHFTFNSCDTANKCRLDEPPPSHLVPARYQAAATRVKRQIEDDVEDSVVKCQRTNSSESTRTEPYVPVFANTHICIMRNGIGDIQWKVLKEQVTRQGGTVTENITNDTTFIVSALDWPRMCRFLGIAELPTHILAAVTPAWISESLFVKHLMATSEYIVPGFRDGKNEMKYADTAKTTTTTQNAPVEIHDSSDEDNPVVQCRYPLNGYIRNVGVFLMIFLR